MLPPGPGIGWQDPVKVPLPAPVRAPAYKAQAHAESLEPPLWAPLSPSRLEGHHLLLPPRVDEAPVFLQMASCSPKMKGDEQLMAEAHRAVQADSGVAVTATMLATALCELGG